MADSNPVDWDALGISAALNVGSLEEVEDLKDVVSSYRNILTYIFSHIHMTL